MSPVLWCLAAAALFGGSTPAAKAILGDFGTLTLAGLLYLGAAGATLPFAAGRGIASTGLARRNLLRLGGAILLGGILGPIFLLWGLAQAPSASVALWLNLETVATALFGWALFKEHLHPRVLGAGGLILLASAILAGPSGGHDLAAAMLVALACVCWGLDNNLTALIDGFTPAQSTCAKGLVAGTFNLVLGLGMERVPAGWAPVGAALALGALGYGLSIVLYVAGAQHLGATRSQLLFSTAPFWGVTLAWTALGEPVQRAQLLAGALIAGGIWLLNTERHDHEHTHERQAHVHWHRHDDGHHTHVHEGQAPSLWHCHEHEHEVITHAHRHRPDLHHRHPHA